MDATATATEGMTPMSKCQRKYPKNDFLPVHCGLPAGHSGAHMNIDKMFRWEDRSDDEGRRDGEDAQG
ncbi:hypothetical protein [Mycolicibacillus koreensis]|uniref:hypothetical protein n=2 Tax=Mycolicibacillus koreensis TaxID=1069220 RepID=UPI0013D4790F|nr:hypothetical protein [Mycolicibacillus koreensis]